MKLPSIFHGISSKLSKNVICCITSNTRGLIPFTIFEMLFPPLAFSSYTPQYKVFFFAKFCRAIPASKGLFTMDIFAAAALVRVNAILRMPVWNLWKAQFHRVLDFILMNSYHTWNKEQIIQSKFQYCLELTEEKPLNWHFSLLFISVTIFCFRFPWTKKWWWSWSARSHVMF